MSLHYSTLANSCIKANVHSLKYINCRTLWLLFIWLIVRLRVFMSGNFCGNYFHGKAFAASPLCK